MRVGILGLGAIGGTLAARLLAGRPAGDELGLAAGAGARLEALRAAGLSVEGRGGALHVPLAGVPLGASLPALGGPYDLLLLCVRAEATAAALGHALPLLSRDGAVVCLQNGLPEEAVAARAGAERTLGAVIGWSATSEGPGRTRVTGRGGFALGGFAPGEPATRARLLRARAVLRRAFPTRVVAGLAAARWGKLALNCAISTLGAVSGLSFGELAARAEARALALRTIGECLDVAAALGIRPARLAGLDPAWLADRPSRAGALAARLALPARHLLFRAVALQRPGQRSGMLPRLLAGRTSGQIDDLNGAVVARARAAGVAAPLNQRLLDLVHAIEEGRAKVDPAHLDALGEELRAPR